MMRIFYLVSAFLLLQTIILYAQQDKLKPFTLNGTINADTGTIELRLLAVADFYPQNLRNLLAQVVNKHFTFSGAIPSPQGFH